MARSQIPRDRLQFDVTPRFDVFYALNVLGDPWDRAVLWRAKTEKLLPDGFGEALKRVAPRPIMWPLLADTLRDAKPHPTFAEILQLIDSLDDDAFRRAILTGVFRETKTVDSLLAQVESLGDAIKSEAVAGNPLLRLMGLHPFRGSGVVAAAFERIITDPAGYRAELSLVLDTFWKSAFRETWSRIQPRMQRRVDAMQAALSNTSLAAFARDLNLPVTFDDRRKIAMSGRGTRSFSYVSLSEIHLLPSAFNHSRFWGAYGDDSTGVRLYFPVFDSSLLDEDARSADPSLGFRALGDTTRYTIASVLARSPQTSVELARAFGVSKATISHHVHLLRAAGLLDQKSTEGGVALTLNRAALEDLSTAAADEMFGTGDPPIIRRSRHESSRAVGTSGMTKVRGTTPGADE